MAGVTLHQELLAILRESGNRWMTTGELADEVNSRGRYAKRDGSKVSAFQVHGRTRNYADLFERDGSRVRARGDRAAVEPLPMPGSTVIRQRVEARRSNSDAQVAVTGALAALGASQAKGVRSAEVPAAPGLYAVHGDSETWQELGLGASPDDRPLYVGKAEDSLASRDLRTHFESGRTGSSTLRRSIAALLADQLPLVPMPRNPAKPGYFSSYGLEAPGDEALTTWMRSRLTLAVWPATRGVHLDGVETAVVGQLQPPLNLAKVRTQWSSTLSEARARMAARAASWRRP